MTEQGYRLGSTVTPGWVGSQAVLPNKDGAIGYIPCSGGSQAELCGPIWPQSVLCDQVGQEVILRQGHWPDSVIGRVLKRDPTVGGAKDCTPWSRRVAVRASLSSRATGYAL